MDKIKRIPALEFRNIVANTGFNPDVLAKDYYLTYILYLLKDLKGVYFKGGTALQKILLHHSRLSEDIDFTVTRNVKEVVKEIETILKDEFGKLKRDKDVEGFTRLVVSYKNFSDEEDELFIDLNKRAKLVLKPEVHKIEHFYEGFIPSFKVSTLAKKEMVAEKVAAAIGRNRPRDHFDIYKIIKAKIPIDMKIVEKKCKQSEHEFSVIRMFNKAKKLKNRWDDDMLILLVEEVSFSEVMQTLAKYFNLKDEKDKLKK